MKRFLSLIILCVLCVSAKTPNAHAGEVEALTAQVSELRRMVQDLSLTVENQQREIALLKGQTPPPFQMAPIGAPGQQVRGRAKWTPDIGVVADVVGASDSPKADAGGADRISVREVEFIVGAPVDPFTRLDATFAFSDFEETSLDEAYATRFGLPLDFTARVGRFKPRIGKALQNHRDSLETVDEPLVIRRYFGEEGYTKSGVDFAKTLDLPWESSHDVAFGVLEGGNGEGGTLFGAARRRPVLYARLRNAWDVGDAGSLELGVSPLWGSSDSDADFEATVLALDATFSIPLDLQRRLKLQGELFGADRRETPETFESRSIGAYALADLRWDPRWSGGFRFDAVEPVVRSVDLGGDIELGYTVYLTFHQTEFARWRLQYSHLDLTAEDEDDRVLVQGTFYIGEHKHKLV